LPNLSNIKFGYRFSIHEMKTNFLYIVLLVVFTSTTAYSQQDALNSQYMYTPLAYNPSYAGINNVGNASLNSRFQWTSLEGNPITNTVSFNTSLVDGKVGLGIMFQNDKLGVSNNNEVQISYAYKITSGSETFSFGLQTGFNAYRSSTDNLTLRVNDDPFFTPGVEKSTSFNIGAGFSYMTDHLFVSFSIPKLLNTKIGSGTEVVEYDRHYYLMGAYVFEFKSGLKLKPSVLLRGVAGAPLATDINLNFLIKRQFWVGGFTRNFKTYGVMAQFDFKQAYKIGYSFEMLGNNFTGYRLPTHEIIFSADLKIFSHQDLYQRFF